MVPISLMPWGSQVVFGQPTPGSPGIENLRSTVILDWDASWTEEIAALAGPVSVADVSGLQRLHQVIATNVRGVYAFQETQPASVTWTRRRGSCSQRLAILESTARAVGIPTNVRGVWVDGRFWYPRFHALRIAIPDRVLLAWPSFHIESAWLSASELFGTVGSLATARPAGFTNKGETVFDALSTTAIDWDGQTATQPGCACDLSSRVLIDLGYFDSRDELFATNGQTLCAPARVLAGQMLGRRIVA